MPRGRPRHSKLDAIRAKAWFNAVKSASGADSAYGVGKLFNSALQKRFEKYARGVIAPNVTTRKLLNKKYPGTRDVFEIGPPRQKDHAPLWKALGGSAEEVWEVLVRFDPEFEVMRFVGAPHQTRVKRLHDSVVPNSITFADGTRADQYPHDYIAVSRGLEPNMISKLYEANKFVVSMKQLTAVIAMWRHSMFIGDSSLPMTYLLNGLMQKAGNDLLGIYGVYEDVRMFIRELPRRPPQSAPLVAGSKCSTPDARGRMIFT